MDLEFIETNLAGLKLVRPLNILEEIDVGKVVFNSSSFAGEGLQSGYKYNIDMNHMDPFHVNGFYASEGNQYFTAQKGIYCFIVIDPAADNICSVILSDRNRWGLYISEGLQYGYMGAESMNILHRKADGLIQADSSLEGADLAYEAHWPIKEMKEWAKKGMI